MEEHFLARPSTSKVRTELEKVGATLRDEFHSYPGQSSGDTWRQPSRGYVSPLLRINEAGQLAGRNLDMISLSNLRIGKPVWGGDGSEKPPLGNETELNVDFCLTWNTDPRWVFLLEQSKNRIFYFLCLLYTCAFSQNDTS